MRGACVLPCFFIALSTSQLVRKSRVVVGGTGSGIQRLERKQGRKRIGTRAQGLSENCRAILGKAKRMVCTIITSHYHIKRKKVYDQSARENIQKAGCARQAVRFIHCWGSESCLVRRRQVRHSGGHSSLAGPCVQYPLLPQPNNLTTVCHAVVKFAVRIGRKEDEGITLTGLRNSRGRQAQLLALHCVRLLMGRAFRHAFAQARARAAAHPSDHVPAPHPAVPAR